jgi:hypothetical protein
MSLPDPDQLEAMGQDPAPAPMAAPAPVPGLEQAPAPATPDIMHRAPAPGENLLDLNAVPGAATGAPLPPGPAPTGPLDGMPMPANGAPKTISGAINESAAVANENGAAAQKVATDEKQIEADKVKLERAEAAALAPTLNHQRLAAEAFANFQQNVHQTYQQDYQKRELAYMDTQKELDAVRAQMHPTDIFGASGVGPVQGTIAMILGAIGGANDGRNSAVTRLDQLAQQRAHMLQQEANLIEKKGGMQENMFGIARQKLGDDQSAYLATYQAQLEGVKAEMQQVSNNFRSPRAQNAARSAMAAIDQKLVAVQTQMGQFNSQQAMQGAVAIGQQSLERDKMALARATGPKSDPESRKLAEAAAATEEAVRLIREIRSGKFSPTENAAKRSQLATVLARAENPGSNRVLTPDTRRAEIEKTGGIPIPFTQGKNRIGDDSGLQNLEDQLIRQQHERDLYTGENTAQRLMHDPSYASRHIMENAPEHQDAGN